jgi:iron complex transport system substrate-binding protein
VAELRRRVDAVRSAVAGLPRPRVFALEWGDPPFNGGHWVPEMIEAAGGDPVLAAPRSPSVRVSWEEIAGAQPDVVVFMPCGYNLDMAVREATATLLDRPELAGASLLVADADSYFSRPGPRLVEGIEHLAEALHPGAVRAEGSHVVAQLR